MMSEMRVEHRLTFRQVLSGATHVLRSDMCVAVIYYDGMVKFSESLRYTVLELAKITEYMRGATEVQTR